VSCQHSHFLRAKRANRNRAMELLVRCCAIRERLQSFPAGRRGQRCCAFESVSTMQKASACALQTNRELCRVQRRDSARGIAASEREDGRVTAVISGDVTETR